MLISFQRSPRWAGISLRHCLQVIICKTELQGFLSLGDGGSNETYCSYFDSVDPHSGQINSCAIIDPTINHNEC